ncbi:hypothetical protein J3R82DRAFT_9730 [Butyriboletus roseoflavus]|nr:hypothetical protein J3R82DRAFT_9730 [Butyriboletus roseoflavus]
MEKPQDANESSIITFEWTLRGLKSLFDASKGESKSKVTKSVKFGAGQWQILFYANSGTEGGGFVSLYLSCEVRGTCPITVQWTREGVFKFSFELRRQAIPQQLPILPTLTLGSSSSFGKTVLFNIKEAHNHSFSSKVCHVFLAQFARRDHVYYHSTPVKESDTFLIICAITSSPQPPIQPPTNPTQPVPKTYLECVGTLLDDPLYSDIEFVVPSRSTPKEKRIIYANKKLLQRADYFQSMFGSGFVEASTDVDMGHPQSDHDEGDTRSDSTCLFRQFEDSDDEEDDLMSDLPDELSFDGTIETDVPETGASHTTGEGSVVEDSAVKHIEGTENVENAVEPEIVAEGDEPRNVRPKLSHPSSPRSKDVALMTDPECSNRVPLLPEIPTVPGPKKMRVIVGDVAYATYKAVLYYIYTEVIVFAPLSSSFTAAASSRRLTATTATTATATPSDSQSSLHDSPKTPARTDNPTSRREWIKKWQQCRPGRPAPCSAKAVYRLADKLGLLELRERAYQHIQKSLTVENIPFEVFSPFSATFAEVRKVQVNYFLEHWGEIRASEAMRKVWRQIRNGRHPGFEEVWPSIALHLEFNPRTGALADTESPET